LLSALWRVLRRPRVERRILLEAVPALLAADFAIVTAGLKATLRLFSRLSGLPFAPRPGGDEEERSEETARLVHLAASSRRLRMNCLRRAVVVWWLLRRQGILCEIHIGVRRLEGRLDGHAWVEHRGRPLHEPTDVAQRYVAFGSDIGQIERWVD
jgi:Transglutaminase-like superfamily